MKSNEKGVTLVELLAALMLVGLVTAIAWTALTIGVQHSAIETSKTHLQQEANLILTSLTTEHRRSDYYYLRFLDGQLEMKSCTEITCGDFERLTDNHYQYTGTIDGVGFADLDPSLKIDPKKNHVKVVLTVTDPQNPNLKVTVTTTLSRILTS